MQQEEPRSSTKTAHELSSVVIPLLKGVVYRETAPDQWSSLLALQPQARDYVSVLGLDLIVDEAEGYAFLRSKPGLESEGAGKLPRLVVRRPLSFPVSLLLALLRKKLAEFDAKGGDTRLVLSREEIVDIVRIFFPAVSNEARLISQIDSYIAKIVDMGFLHPLRNQDGMFEVRRILKAYVDAQWLSEFDQRLQEYCAYIQNKGSGAQDE